MSYTELHAGKLTPVKTISNHQEFMDFVVENELTGRHEISIDEYLRYSFITDVTTKKTPILLCSSNDMDELPKYCFYKNVIYRFDNYTVEDDDYINKFIRNSDGSIDFINMFHNAWRDNFSEELQDGLDELLNKEKL